MESFSALLAIGAGNSSVTGEFPSQRPVTRSIDVFFDLRVNRRLSKQQWGWWFETPSRPLWHHSNVVVIMHRDPSPHWLHCVRDLSITMEASQRFRSNFKYDYIFIYIYPIIKQLCPILYSTAVLECAIVLCNWISFFKRRQMPSNSEFHRIIGSRTGAQENVRICIYLKHNDNNERQHLKTYVFCFWGKCNKSVIRYNVIYYKGML